jgi:signal transduction histidine kinase
VVLKGGAMFGAANATLADGLGMPVGYRYLAAVGVLTAGVFVRWLLDPLLSYGHAFLGPTVAGALVAAGFGFGPACFAIGLGFVVSRYLFVPPRYTLVSDLSPFAASLAVSLAVSVSLAAMSALLRRSSDRSKSQAARLREEVGRRAQTESVLRRLIDVQETEKQVIGHDVHDGVLQHVIGARMLLEGLKDALVEPEHHTVLAAAMSSLSRGLEDGRQLVRGVRPTVLDDFGLEAAVHDLREQHRTHGIDVSVDVDLGGATLSPATSTTVYRIVQECLSNVRRHSGAVAAHVGIRWRRDADSLDLIVEDRGRGFDGERAKQAGFGLVGVRERTKLAGGTCEVVSSPGNGTRIHVQLPTRGSPPTLQP